MWCPSSARTHPFIVVGFLYQIRICCEDAARWRTPALVPQKRTFLKWKRRTLEHITVIRKLADANDFTCHKTIQPGKLKHLKCRTFGNEMLQYELELKTRRHILVVTFLIHRRRMNIFRNLVILRHE